MQEGRRDIRDRDQRIMGETAVRPALPGLGNLPTSPDAIRRVVARMDEFAVLHVTRKASEALPSSWYEPGKGSGDVTSIRVSHVVTSETSKVTVPGTEGGCSRC